LDAIDKKALSERDICTQFITPAIVQAGWSLSTQVREEVTFTRGRVLVDGRQHRRGESRRADYVLSWKPNFPLAVLEAKDSNHAVSDGMQQALDYAEALDVPFVFSSNGDAFQFHDRTACGGAVETLLPLHAFPSPDELWQRYCAWKGLTPPQQSLVTQDYYTDASGKEPRYYQLNAINRTVEAVARGQKRVLLVMATGTGKTYVAFQVIWRLWKAQACTRILFLADRNVLIDQTRTNDFKPFGRVMTKITDRKVDKSYEIYLALYQAVSGSEEQRNVYRQFSPEFFDLVVVDECHRGSAAENSAWREILDYFRSATQIGLTATPKETCNVSNIDYFGKPVYTYSLKQGILDGFLAPYKVVRIDIDKDLTGWRPEQGKLDKHGLLIEDRVYNQRDFDRTLVLDQRTDLVARKVTEYLQATDRYAKTIVFCEDNLLFFTKGEPTKDIWYYEHPYPAGYKSYSKTKPIRIEEFTAEEKWWPAKKRRVSDHAWKALAAQVKASGCNLDMKNPNDATPGHDDPDQLLADYQAILSQVAATRDKLKEELRAALEGKS
jgi:type I restriction enzyme R subunit